MMYRALVMVIIALTGQTILPISWGEKYHYYIAKERKSSWKTKHIPFPEEVAAQKKLFGYDLAITHLEDKSSQTVQATSSRIKLFVHGFAENRFQAIVFADKYNLISGDLVTFNLPDRVSSVPPIANRILRTSFGQMNEVLPTLYTMNYIRKKLNPEAFDLYGFSRGGAVLINMLAVLCDSNGKYDTQLLKIGIDSATKEELITMINKGSIILHAPLVDMQLVDQKRVYGLAALVAKIKLGKYKLASYEPDGLQPIDSLQKIDRIKTNVLTHFQYNDTSVLNEHDAALYESFSRLNAKQTFLHLGNDGGHKAKPKSFSLVTHTFYKTIGAAYSKAKADRYKRAFDSIQQKGLQLRQPDADEAKNEIESFYKRCEKRKRT